jgi:hypothetical protein
MDLEGQVRDAILRELERQVGERPLAFKVRDGVLEIEGVVDLEALVMVVVGSVAGGP